MQETKVENLRSRVIFLTSPPQSHLGRQCHYPHVRECILPLRVLAVACTMRNEALRDVKGALQGVKERYGSIVHRPQNPPFPLRHVDPI